MNNEKIFRFSDMITRRTENGVVADEIELHITCDINNPNAIVYFETKANLYHYFTFKEEELVELFERTLKIRNQGGLSIFHKEFLERILDKINGVIPNEW